MATWKFTDQYGATYPALANSILNRLVFDIQGTSPVSGTTFTGTLDLTATGDAMKVLATVTGVTTIPMTGTVDTSNNTLKVSLNSTNDDVLKAALSKNLPLIGPKITGTNLVIQNVTAASLTKDEEPATDEMDLEIDIKINDRFGGKLTTQVPMADGFFTVTADLKGVGIGLDDLNFLLPGDNKFSAYFPSNDLGKYYDPNSPPGLYLLKVGITFYIATTPALKVLPATITAVIGITQIPLYEQKLYLDPLGVWVTVSNLTTNPTASWGLLGSIILCNYNTPGKTSDPDFEFDFQMTFPTTQNPVFSISGELDNPYDQPVSLILQDLMGPTTNVGISDKITIEKFDFSAAADTKTGTISEFGFDVAMSGQFGIFEKLELEEFSISVQYSS
jgi:hypothetical protein